MRTLVIKYQIGTCAPGWYPLWQDVRITAAQVAEMIARERAGNGAFKNILEHRVIEDGLTQAQADAKDRAAERAESRRCDAGYIHDVRFGDDS